ncbi:uncharacterized protein LOC133898804 [Phragmites australis]|uniref:uncharacterized protein LOC133898804 n=1 Tax=Phragmites australis TaxID=29695 RepID=UPI002D79BEBC|nr:uncharacterized protein LOC133898804 [Phragmites australis]
MATELLPVVDLRGLSQSDLDSLAAASAHALAPRSCPDADPLQPLKIDRAVFNESAGSRKQTFSRLRLGAASARPTSPSSAPPSSARNDPDSGLVAYHLRRLFAPDAPSLPLPPEAQTLALIESSPSPPPDPDRETTNSKGISVDLVRLAGMVDPYDAELRKRTAGLPSETELMGFIGSVAGKWVSQRQRRKFVDASFFGDHLPSGWKLLLGLKRKERMTWVHCFSYVSPKGNQFATCKEVSAYLMSLLGYPEAKTVTIQYNSTGQHDLCADHGGNDAAGFQHQIGSRVDNPNVLPVTSVSFSSYSGDLKDKDERNVDTVNVYECQKCNLTFCDQASYTQHHLSSHEISAKRRRTGKFGEPVVGKDGKFECPVCHKTFAEESRYFGHVGVHARYQGMTPEAFLDNISSGKVDRSSSAEISFSLQELTESPEQNSKISAGEAGFQHLSGSNEHGGNSSKVKELFGTNCLDNFNGPNKAWHRPEEIPPITYPPSSCNETVSKIASNSNGHTDVSLNGLSEVNVFNDQAGSHHVFRTNTFGTANPYEDQIIDHGMAAPKHGEVNNSVKARDVNLNSCLDINCENMARSISFPIASANNETSTALIEDNQSSFTANCFSGSFNSSGGTSGTSSCPASTNKIISSIGVMNKTSVTASTCFSASYGNDNGGGKANFFGNKDNTVVYQSNMGMRDVSPLETKADCFTSHSGHSKDSDNECASNTKEQMDNIKNRASNEAGLGIEAYNNNVFGGVSHERGFAQFNNSFTHIKPNVSSHCSLPESNTLKNLTKGSDVNFMKGSFVNRPISNNEANVSMHEVMGKSSNKMQNRYNDCAPGCVPLVAASTSQNANGLMSTQDNFGSISSMVHSAGDIPMSNTTQDQCDLQLGFGAQKQQIFSGYGELRSTTARSPQLGSMPRNNSLPTGSSQFENMDRPNSFSTGSSQFGSLTRPNFVPTSFQFGIMARPNSVPPVESSQFGSMPRPNSVPQAKSSQLGSMDRPNSIPPANYSQFGTMVRPIALPPAESSQFGSMLRQNFVSRTEPTLVLGYAPQMGNGPPVQVGWDLSSSKVTGGMITCVCISCNSQFHHFGSVDGQQPVSFDLICPACKDRVSGHRNMHNNGPW